MKTMVLAMGLAVLFTGCCNTCTSRPAVVREKVDECGVVIPGRLEPPCDTTPKDIGLDGW